MLIEQAQNKIKQIETKMKSLQDTVLDHLKKAKKEKFYLTNKDMTHAVYEAFEEFEKQAVTNPETDGTGSIAQTNQ